MSENNGSQECFINSVRTQGTKTLIKEVHKREWEIVAIERELVLRELDNRENLHDEAMDVAKSMEKYGGSFVKALAQCIYKADPFNLKKIRNTFSNYWVEYRDMKTGDD